MIAADLPPVTVRAGRHAIRREVPADRVDRCRRVGGRSVRCRTVTTHGDVFGEPVRVVQAYRATRRRDGRWIVRAI